MRNEVSLGIEMMRSSILLRLRCLENWERSWLMEEAVNGVKGVGGSVEVVGADCGGDGGAGVGETGLLVEDESPSSSSLD